MAQRTYKYHLAVDPGTHRAGMALFKDGRLFKWFRGEQRKEDPTVDKAFRMATVLVEHIEAEWSFLFEKENLSNTRVIFEYPRNYNQGQSRVPPDDILALCLVLGGVGALLTKRGFQLPDMMRPSDWKDQVKKKAMTERIKLCLSPKELALLGKADHNVVDAVGIGMKSLKRLPIAGTPIEMWFTTDD